jgi:hypothetical protein
VEEPRSGGAEEPRPARSLLALATAFL